MPEPKLLSIELVQNLPDIQPVPAAHPHHELVYILTEGYRVSAKGCEYTGHPEMPFSIPAGCATGYGFLTT